MFGTNPLLNRSLEINERFLNRLRGLKEGDLNKTKGNRTLLETQQAKTLLDNTETRGTIFSLTQPNSTLDKLKFNWDNFIDYPNHRGIPPLPQIPREEGSKLKIGRNDQLLKVRIISLIKKPKYISPRYVLNISHEDDGYYTYIYDTDTDASFWSTYNDTDGFRIATITQQFDKKVPQGHLIPKFKGWKLLKFDDGFGIRNHKKKSKRRKKKTKRRGKKSKKKKSRVVGKKRRVGKKSKKKGNVSEKKHRVGKRARTRGRSRS